MGKISRQVLPKGGRRGNTGLKGKIHRSVSRVPVKKTIVRDRTQDYHGVDKLEIEALEAEEAAGWPEYNSMLVKTKLKELKSARAKLAIKDGKHDRKYGTEARGAIMVEFSGVSVKYFTVLSSV